MTLPLHKYIYAQFIQGVKENRGELLHQAVFYSNFVGKYI